MKILLSLLVFALPLLAQDPEEIMKQVRQVAALQDNQALQGVIRKGGQRTPISLFLEGGNIQFALDGGKERFHLRLNDNDQDLLAFQQGKWVKFPPRKIAQPIAGSDVTYEDLALKFLYWRNPRIVGEERIALQDTWRIHLVNPDRAGRYREVSAWVSKKHRALMRVIGYDAQRQPVKQFEVTDIMNVGGITTVKTLKVSSLRGGRVAGSTYVDFEKPSKGARRR